MDSLWLDGQSTWTQVARMARAPRRNVQLEFASRYRTLSDQLVNKSARDAQAISKIVFQYIHWTARNTQSTLKAWMGRVRRYSRKSAREDPEKGRCGATSSPSRQAAQAKAKRSPIIDETTP